MLKLCIPALAFVLIAPLAVGGRAQKSLASPRPTIWQCAAGVTLTGDTSRPDISTFAQGESVELTFDVEGLKAAGPAVTLQLSIVDEHERKIDAREIPVQADAAGHWQTRL